MKMEILAYPEASLGEVCSKVEEITPELKEQVENMIETMYEDDGVGLAAPQVGIQKRLIVIDPSGPKERTDLQVIINPEIVEKSAEKVDSEEACLSCPGFKCTIKRYAEITVTGTDLDGNELRIEADDFLAIVLQHEIDHLDGTLIVDRVGRLKRAMYDKKVKKWLKNAGN